MKRFSTLKSRRFIDIILSIEGESAPQLFGIALKNHDIRYNYQDFSYNTYLSDGSFSLQCNE